METLVGVPWRRVTRFSKVETCTFIHVLRAYSQVQTFTGSLASQKFFNRSSSFLQNLFYRKSWSPIQQGWTCKSLNWNLHIVVPSGSATKSKNWLNIAQPDLANSSFSEIENKINGGLKQSKIKERQTWLSAKPTTIQWSPADVCDTRHGPWAWEGQWAATRLQAHTAHGRADRWVLAMAAFRSWQAPSSLKTLPPLHRLAQSMQNDLAEGWVSVACLIITKTNWLSYLVGTCCSPKVSRDRGITGSGD